MTQTTLDDLRRDLDRLARGGTLTLEAIEACSDKLDDLLRAIAKPEGPSPLVELLETLIAAMHDSTAAMARVEAAVAALPERLVAALRDSGTAC